MSTAGAAALPGTPTGTESLQAPASPELLVPTETPVDAVVLGRGADVFARINKGLSPNACAAGSNSERWRQRYAGNPVAFANRMQDILPLLDFVSVEVERAGLPSEFVFIPLVESWYTPNAIGSGGPAGMWQMISSTSKNHGIHIQPGYDGRLSPIESTRAALSYLKTLQGMFDNWQAITMAYNAGEGRMMKAFQRADNRTVSAADRKPHGLSNITYDYVAKLQALSCLVQEPERQGLSLPLDSQFVPLAPVLMDARVRSLDQFAALHGKNASELRQLNPGFKSGRIVADVPRLVLTPIASSQAPIDPSALAMLDSSESTSGDELDEQAAESIDDRNIRNVHRKDKSEPASTHKVRAGESLWSIAKLYSMTIDHLRRVNRMGQASVVRPGQMLKLVP